MLNWKRFTHFTLEICWHNSQNVRGCWGLNFFAFASTSFFMALTGVEGQKHHLNVWNENLCVRSALQSKSDAPESGYTIFPENSLRSGQHRHESDSDMIYEFKIISMDNWQLSTTLHHSFSYQWITWKKFCRNEWWIHDRISIQHVTLLYAISRFATFLCFVIANCSLIVSCSQMKWNLRRESLTSVRLGKMLTAHVAAFLEISHFHIFFLHTEFPSRG